MLRHFSSFLIQPQRTLRNTISSSSTGLPTNTNSNPNPLPNSNSNPLPNSNPNSNPNSYPNSNSNKTLFTIEEPVEEEVKALDLHRLFHVFTCSTGIANYRRTWSGGFRGDSWEDDETYYGKQATATKREIFDENGTVFGPAVKNVKFIKRFIESGGDLAKSLPPSPPPSSVDSESIDFQKHAEAISSELKDVDLPTVRRRATAFALETMKVAKASVVEFVGGYKEGRESEYEKARTIYFRALDEDYAQEKGTGNNMWKDDDNLGRNIELIRGKLKNVVEEINEATATKDKSSSTNTDKKIDEIGENFERNVEFLKDKANELMRENKNVDVHENVEKNLQFLKNQFDEAVKNIDAMKKK